PVPMGRSSASTASTWMHWSSMPSHSSSGGTFCSSMNTRVRTSRSGAMPCGQLAKRRLYSLLIVIILDVQHAGRVQIKQQRDAGFIQRVGKCVAVEAAQGAEFLQRACHGNGQLAA